MLTYGKDIGLWQFNIPAHQCCLGESDYCRRTCYNNKGNNRFDNVAESRQKNLEWTRSPTFIQDMFNELIILDTDLARIHSSGDYYSPRYFRSWLTIAKMLPGIEFLSFTKNWRVRGWLPILMESLTIPNFKLWFSADPSTADPSSIWSRCSYVSETESTCGKQRHDGTDCRSCRHCFNTIKGSVTFKRH